MMQDLLAVLESKNNGTYVYDDAQLKVALPILCLGIMKAFPEATLPDYALEGLADMGRAAGLKGDETPAAAAEKIKAYVDARSADTPLLKALDQAMRGALGSNNFGAARELAAALGVDVKRAPLDSGARPVGTIPAGPAARFAAMKAPTKK